MTVVALKSGIHPHADAPRPTAPLFDGHQDERGPPPVELAAPTQPRLRPPNPGVVDLDRAMQRFAGGIDHRPAQFVEHQPRGLEFTRDSVTERGGAKLRFVTRDRWHRHGAARVRRHVCASFRAFVSARQYRLQPRGPCHSPSNHPLPLGPFRGLVAGQSRFAGSRIQRATPVPALRYFQTALTPVQRARA